LPSVAAFLWRVSGRECAFGEEEMWSLSGRRKNSSHIRRVDRKSWTWWAHAQLVCVLLRTCLIALLASGGSCAFFYRQPPLPKNAAIEATGTPQSDEKFTTLVQKADIIYFPIELLGPPPRTEPATKLMEALQRNGDSFAIGSDLIGGEEQTLLDQWAKRTLSTEDLFSRLHLVGTERERANCRAMVDKAKDWDTHFLALRCPAKILAAARSATLDVRTRSEISRGFVPPPGDFQRFVERSSAARMTEIGLRTAYETALLVDEFAAERLVRHFRANRDRKLLIFLHQRYLGNTRGVPYFVAQKIRARQLVLESETDRSSRSQLLAWSGRDGAWGWDGARGRCDGWGWYDGRGSRGKLEVIDRSPGTAVDQL
jgi:uncharacterized iron-regulated protein